MALDLGAAPSGQLPPEPLLRWGGSSDPSILGPAVENDGIDDARGSTIARDAARLLVMLGGQVIPSRWTSASFAREVEAVRRHLAPIRTPEPLLSSFGREAFQGRRAVAAPIGSAGPVRIAYTIRWIELVADLHMPEWSLWTRPCTPGR